MIVNKANLDINKFVAKDSVRPEINGIRFTGTTTVATDSFRLIEVDAPKYNADMIPDNQDNTPALDTAPITATVPIELTEQTKKNIGKGKLLPVSAFAAISQKEKEIEGKVIDDSLNHASRKGYAIEGEYPEYKKIIPEKGKDMKTIMLNAEYIRDMADFFKKYSISKRVAVSFRGPHDAVMFEGETEHGQAIRALIMPIMQ